ncbi:MAG: serine hydrolase [Phaeodactylibacter sp.]|nr:serine hydrolase [Phaeodactylibacter sp.]MCB9265290.1 serine hydrolase [Lewinellaceae bacterium]MCB9287045.1 serine hydrolase [Lewinellaceae bacterium]
MRGITIFCLLALLAVACLPERHEPLPALPGLAPFLRGDVKDVEAIISNMSLEQKLGQLIIVARPGRPEGELFQWIRKGRVGGVALSGLTLEHFLKLRDSLQQAAPFPLFYTTFGGALFNNQFSDAVAMPSMDALQALASDSMKQQVRQIFLQQAEALGLNPAPAPYLDPVEQRFSLSGEGLEQHVRAIAWLNERHMLSVADGFAATSLLQPAKNNLQDSLLLGFQHLAEAGVSGFWVHPYVFESQGLIPASIENFFRGRLQFDGLLLAHLTADNQLDEILASGVDLIVTHNGPGFVMDYLLAAYHSGELSEQALHARLRRILLAKLWISTPAANQEAEFRHQDAASAPRTLPASMVGGRKTDNPEFSLSGERLAEYFKDSRWAYWQRRLREESIVIASNPDNCLPFRQLGRSGFLIFHLGKGDTRAFDETFDKYAASASWQGNSWEPLGQQLARLRGTEQVVLALHDYTLDSLQATALLSLARRLPLTVVNFRRPETLSLLDTSLVVVQAFEDGDDIQEIVVQALFGGIPTSGKLPYTLNRFFGKGKGEKLAKTRLRYGIPEQVGIAPQKLVGIDAIVQTAIDESVFPGCQAVVVKDGTVVYDKALGFHTYSKEQPVERTDLFDIASITKVAATTLAAMKLYENKAISINGRLRQQMSLPRNSRLRNLTLKRLMTHQSGLQSHMPVVPYLLYRDMENTDCSRYFCNHPSDTFSIQVAKDFYFDRRYYEKIMKDVNRLRPRYRYRYSDVNFILLQKLVEEKAGEPLDSFVDENFYSRLGLRRTCFRPLMQWDSSEIVPTQLDLRWRHQLIHGFVHDETAALLGGVAGNAGLFSTAEGLAVIFQMLLDGGTYGGENYLNPETVSYFTSATHGNHRGLGFDKPYKKTIAKGRFPEQVSEATFGHTGFTGTCAWADPDAGLVYIFLSNRIHPDANNHKIFEKRVRERIHQVIYDALDTYVPEMPELLVQK